MVLETGAQTKSVISSTVKCEGMQARAEDVGYPYKMQSPSLGKILQKGLQ